MEQQQQQQQKQKQKQQQPGEPLAQLIKQQFNEFTDSQLVDAAERHLVGDGDKRPLVNGNIITRSWAEIKPAITKKNKVRSRGGGGKGVKEANPSSSQPGTFTKNGILDRTVIFKFDPHDEFITRKGLIDILDNTIGFQNVEATGNCSE